MQDTLRERLRRETRGPHDRVDAAFGQFDLLRTGGFSRFLAAHLAALDSLAQCTSHSAFSDAGLDLGDMRRALVDDLDQLAGTRVKAEPPLDTTLDTLAVSYVISGSRLGMKLLKSRWDRATEPAVRRAHRYIGMSPNRNAWRDICARLTAQTAGSGDWVVSDAITTFAVFESAAALTAPILQE